MQITAYAHSDSGRARALNEDFFVVRPDLGLFLVCDGMGGKDGGDVAARTAATVVEHFLYENRAVLSMTENWSVGKEAIVAIVRSAVELASSEVFKIATERGRVGMGTTLTLLLVCGTKGVMAHVGDSRLYLLRNGELYQLSEDHNFLTELRKKGGEQSEKMKNSPYAKALTRAIGIQGRVRTDILGFDVLPHDTFLLCSDGVSRPLSPARLCQALDGGDYKALPGSLVEEANRADGKDNLTAVVVHALSDDEEDIVRGTEVSLRLSTLREVSLFGLLSLKELVKVLDHFETRSFAPHTTVIAEGAHDACLYVIIEGQLSVHRGGEQIAALEAGTHFGEMALLNTAPRSATVTSTTGSRVLVLEKSEFEGLCDRDPELGVKILRCLARELSSRLLETTGRATGHH